MYQHILYGVDDPVATLTLNRPERLNAMTRRMEGEIKHAVARAEADPAVVAIVLTGAGRGFCAGADLKDLQALGEGRGFGEVSELSAEPGDPQMGPSFRGPWSYLLSVRKPIVAALNGPTAGLGFAAALFADVRFASERATFTTAFSRRGLIAEWGIGWTLPRLVGPAHALELLWSARVFDAAEALHKRLVNRVVADADVETETYATAQRIAAGAPLVARWHKQFIDRLSVVPQVSAGERDEGYACFDTEDYQIGVAAFLAKTKPRFEGK